EGLSASQIAGRLGSVTRNAVIGKVHRLGLSGRATTSRMKSLRPRPRANPMQANSVMAKRNPKSQFGGRQALRTIGAFDAEPYVSPVEELVIP
ncbi:GcrA family cell cycle regulator, partial [Klebsiella pneumoniae]|uniref:GcrA family cell cycle regulator n=1 Tax=Klebsiella pneumoniae TaxID=573 RepID=UPI003852BDA6